MCGAASVCQAGHCGPSWAMGQAAAAAELAQGQPQTHVLRLARGSRVGSDTARPGRLWLPQAARGPAAAGREPRHESGGFTLAEGKTALRGWAARRKRTLSTAPYLFIPVSFNNEIRSVNLLLPRARRYVCILGKCFTS